MQNKDVPVFVATSLTQGYRKNDFCWVPEGEIVKLSAFLCTNGYADDSCGCHRSLVGIYSSKSTTTMQIKLGFGTKQDLIELLYKSYQRDGWAEGTIEKVVLLERCKQEAKKLSLAAANFSIDTIVEWREGLFVKR